MLVLDTPRLKNRVYLEVDALIIIPPSSMNLILSISIIACSYFGTVSCWGGDLHRLITSRALGRISDSDTLTFLLDLLGTQQSIIEASTWADSDEARDAYPGSEDLHFSHTPWHNCQPFVLDRDCPMGECIVTGIAEKVQIALDTKRNKRERGDALKFVIHLFADIHQPLHTGFAEDSGGTNIRLASTPPMSLHQMWDYGMMDGWSIPPLVGTPSTRLAKILASVKIPTIIDSYESVLELTSALATESTLSVTCNFAYQNEANKFITSGSSLSESYLTSRRSVIVDRVDLASIRLARLLQAMAKSVTGRRIGGPGGAGAAPSSPRTVPQNRFETLAIDFDPEDYLVDLSGWNSPSRSRARRVARDRFEGIDSLESTDVPATIDGVNVTDIILTKVNEQYVITCAGQVVKFPNYQPQSVIISRVKFSRNRGDRSEPFRFLVDTECWPRPTNESLLKIFLHMRRVPASEMQSLLKSVRGQTTSVALVYPDMFNYAPIDGEFVTQVSQTEPRKFRSWSRLLMGNPSLSTARLFLMIEDEKRAFTSLMSSTNTSSLAELEPQWDRQVATKISELVVLSVGNVQAVFWRKTLSNPNTQSRSVIAIPCLDPNQGSHTFLLLVDSNIGLGDMTRRIYTMIERLILKQQINPTDVPPSIYTELQDVDTVLFGKKSDRWKELKTVQSFHMVPSMVSLANSLMSWTTR